MGKEKIEKAVEATAAKTPPHVFNAEEPKMYRRVRALGMNIIRFDNKKTGDTKAVEVREFGTFEKKDGDKIDYVEVMDLDTGEEGRMWLDGALRHNLRDFEKSLGLPFAVEIQFTGKDTALVEFVNKITGKTEKSEQEINTYKFWEIKALDKN